MISAEIAWSPCREDIEAGVHTDEPAQRIACDAMFGGVARWLRMLGVDTTYTPHIDDGELVRQALAEKRLVVSSDRRLFERKPFVSGELRGLFVPVGLGLDEQVRFVVRAGSIRPGFPRCTTCNGELAPASRDEVAAEVPARSLIWARDFYRCQSCGQVFWEGTHWRRISKIVESFADTRGSERI